MDDELEIEFDDSKDAWNLRERGISFTQVREFDFETAVELHDTRKEYGETRVIAYGFIESRLHVLCYKPLGKRHIRVISLRKANRRERTSYEKAIYSLD